jgi:hypothetical protein
VTPPPPRAAVDEPIDALAGAAARALARGGPGHVLLWAAVPTALLDLRTGGTANGDRRAVRTLLAGAARSRGSSLSLVGDVLFAHEGANPAATLRPVIEALAARHGRDATAVTVRPAFGHLASGLRAARHAEATVADELGMPTPNAMVRALQSAVRAGARARAALDRTRPSLVVVASQHSTSSRAIIAAARHRSVPTAYLPHAPAADTYQYRDLPTDFAGLRGEREVDFYRELGVERSLAVIGNPQVHVRVPERLDPSMAVVFAPRPIPVEDVRAQVADIDRAASDVVVSPHPRMQEARYSSLWPAHWVVHAHPTIELLHDGHPCVLQISSGVAWEAMAHGVPVVELAPASPAPPLYPVIRAPYATVCTSGADVPGAVAQARVDAADAGVRSRLTAWAAEWCARTGEDATEAAVHWLEECAASTAPGPLLDHWALAGAA